MHTLLVYCGNNLYRVLYLELLPLLHQARLLEQDTHARISTVYELLNSLQPSVFLHYLRNALSIEIPEDVKFYYIKRRKYASLAEFENEVLKRNPDLIQCKYSATGKITNISFFSKERLQVELAKIGYAYNYTRVETARKAFRTLSDPTATSDSESEHGSESFPSPQQKKV